MTSINAQWRNGFNAALQARFAITINVVSLTDTDLGRYSVLPPEQAALQFGEDYDLDRVDQVGRERTKGAFGPLIGELPNRNARGVSRIRTLVCNAPLRVCRAGVSQMYDERDTNVIHRQTKRWEEKTCSSVSE